MQEIESLGAGVCGVSVDRSERLAEFAAKYQLPFLLLSDRGGRVAACYGSLIDLGLLKLARRNTFLIGTDGRIEKRYLGVQPAKNATEVVADLRALNADAA